MKDYLFSTQIESALNIINQGGPVVIILIGLSVIATTFILIKLFQIIWFRIGSNSGVNKVIELWLKGYTHEADQPPLRGPMLKLI